MSDTIKHILDWYNQYNGFDIVIKTQTKEFSLHINNSSLPHLLGLHYISKGLLKGQKLYRSLKNRTDTEIYSLIMNSNKGKLKSVQNRVEKFRYFMENLDKSILYENTSQTTNLKSEFFLLEIEDNKYLQLGIAKDRTDIDYLETFVVDNKNRYIDGSKISENVVSIERYKEDELIPFSFDAKKNEILLEAYKKQPDFNYQDCLVELEKDYEDGFVM